MKKLVLILAAAAAYYAFRSIGQRQAPAAGAAQAPQQPADELAHKLQDAWADHHTVA